VWRSGARLLWEASGERLGSVGEADAAAAAVREAERAIDADGPARVRLLDRHDAFVDVVPVPWRLIVVGAVEVAAAVPARTAAGLAADRGRPPRALRRCPGPRSSR